MFPLTIRTRQRRDKKRAGACKESPPTTMAQLGGASTRHSYQDEKDFGVKSISEWGSEVILPSSSVTSASQQTMYTTSQDKSKEDQLAVDTVQDDSGRQMFESEESNNTACPSQPQLRAHVPTDHPGLVAPPSPEDTVHPLNSRPMEDTSPSPRSRHQYRHNCHNNPIQTFPATVHHLRLADLPEPETPTSPSLPASEPSSPMSFASIPSYVASLSSLSRTSSLASPISGLDDQEHRHDHHHQEEGSGTAELVLPQLSLPNESLSLHLSLPRWLGNTDYGYERSHTPINVAFIGTREVAERVLRELKESGRVEIVKFDSSIGIVDNGRIAMRLITGLGIAEVQHRVSQAYQTLSKLLTPLTPETRESNDKMRKLVASWAEKEGWICGVVLLSEGKVKLERLDSLIPTSIVLAGSLKTSAEEPSQTKSETSFARLTPLQSLAEPTPRPSVSSECYFSPQMYSPSASPELQGENGVKELSLSLPTRRKDLTQSLLSDEAEGLLHAIESSHFWIEECTSSFLIWRQRKASTSSSMNSPSTSPSASLSASQSSAYGWGAYGGIYGGPMPTVARAQGGGEWEANLSRRVAIRRETIDAAGHASSVKARPKKRRRSFDKYEKDKCPSLFPRTFHIDKDGKEKNWNFITLFQRTFACGQDGKGIRRWWNRRGVWKWSVVLGVVVVAGWGFWAKGQT
ncbi:uncharacterized protein L203_105415 [Cryptococcus depauperatus CBS 7841]|uniref:Uncharacterized protein n=1 Tax=Cryptococcus depauperatus CBS 7841 TaxID=1295531 RepID=A0A1E3ICT1_9TREE|nr:hypothetical protein L203_04091 [Cryptococcus depauperatus CBS 7841]